MIHMVGLLSIFWVDNNLFTSNLWETSTHMKNLVLISLCNKYLVLISLWNPITTSVSCHRPRDCAGISDADLTRHLWRWRRPSVGSSRVLTRSVFRSIAGSRSHPWTVWAKRQNGVVLDVVAKAVAPKMHHEHVTPVVIVVWLEI